MRVRVEQGPKGKKNVAYAIDWPGLERGAKTEELALAKLADSRNRYLPIAREAGLEFDYAGEGDIEVTDRYIGTGSTDFWGISFASAPAEIEQTYDAEAFEQHLALLQSSWRFFDAVAARVSPELKRGPRGGGRDRDHIVRHVLFNEADWAKGIDVQVEQESLLDPAGRQAYRDQFAAALRETQAAGKMAKTWTLSFLVRHSAYHTLDHAWEMEDKDLTGKDAGL
jgi:hypothetical protein